MNTFCYIFKYFFENSDEYKWLINNSYKPYYPGYEWSIEEATEWHVLFYQGGWSNIENCTSLDDAQKQLAYYRDDLYKSYGLSWKIARYFIKYKGIETYYFDTETEANAFAEANQGTVSPYIPVN